MPDNPRDRIRKLVHEGRYYLTIHAEEEMDDDNILQVEVERVLTDGVLVERQRDKQTGEQKFIMSGMNLGIGVEVVVKLGITGEIVVITTYLTEK